MLLTDTHDVTEYDVVDDVRANIGHGQRTWRSTSRVPERRRGETAMQWTPLTGYRLLLNDSTSVCPHQFNEDVVKTALIFGLVLRISALVSVVVLPGGSLPVCS